LSDTYKTAKAISLPQRPLAIITAYCVHDLWGDEIHFCCITFIQKQVLWATRLPTFNTQHLFTKQIAA